MSLQLGQQRRTLGPNRLLLADRVQSFSRFGFDAHTVYRNTQNVGDMFPHGTFERRKTGFFRKNGAVHVENLETTLSHLATSHLQHFTGVASRVARIRIGKQLADVAHPGSAENRVGNRMQQHVGVTVTDETTIMGYFQFTKLRSPTRIAAL